MLSVQEVKHIAKLARLGLAEEEVKKFQKELSSVLDYIDKLNKVDILGVEPTSHSVLVENIIRKDEEKNKDQSEKLLNLVPDKKERHLKVKQIL